MSDLADLLGLGGVVAATAATYGFFHWFGSKSVSGEAKDAVSRWFLNKQVRPIDLQNAYKEVFQKLYSPSLLSWRAFARSATFSVLLYVVYLLSFFLFRPFAPPLGGLFALTSYATDASANIISDYLSLFIIGRWLEGGEQAFGLGVLRAVSAALSIVAAIYLMKLVMMAGVSTLVPLEYVPSKGFMGELQDVFRFEYDRRGSLEGFLLRNANGPALAVHAWIPIMALSLLVLKCAAYLSKYVKFFRWLLNDGKENAFEAVGYAAASLVFVAGCLWKLVGAIRG